MAKGVEQEIELEAECRQVMRRLYTMTMRAALLEFNVSGIAYACMVGVFKQI